MSAKPKTKPDVAAQPGRRVLSPLNFDGKLYGVGDMVELDDEMAAKLAGDGVIAAPVEPEPEAE